MRPNKHQKTPTLVITPGDPEGIGPEILIQLIKKNDPSLRKGRFVFVGALGPFKRIEKKFKLCGFDSLESVMNQNPKHRFFFIEAPSETKSVASLPGYQSGWSIEKSVAMIQSGLADALVTGPIDKQRLQQGGFPFTGHTDFLAALTKTAECTMVLFNPKMVVALVTTHVPLSQVSSSLREASIVRATLDTTSFLQKDLGIRRPRIAVLGLNPHAGDHGVLGDEEDRIILPAIKTAHDELLRLGNKSVQISGPHAADGLFGRESLRKQHDAVVAMYHDQGLIAVKTVDFRRTVNISLGLPFVRTSVDHGTAFDIVGKGTADSSSFREAITQAARITIRRKRQSR